jgi:hypothetical protein
LKTKVKNEKKNSSAAGVGGFFDMHICNMHLRVCQFRKQQHLTSSSRPLLTFSGGVFVRIKKKQFSPPTVGNKKIWPQNGSHSNFIVLASLDESIFPILFFFPLKTISLGLKEWINNELRR